MEIEYRNEIADADSFFSLYQTTGWDENNKKSNGQLYNAIKNSWYMFCAYFNKQLIGCGRIISDGYLHTYINEMIIHPDYQRLGIGNKIIDQLIHRCLDAGIKDIQLFCAAGKIDFYQKNGFNKRPDNAPGMQYKNH